jgi:hypothetical protein
MMDNPFHGNWILSRISTVVVYAGDDKFFFLRLEESVCLSRKIDDDEPAN